MHWFWGALLMGLGICAACSAQAAQSNTTPAAQVAPVAPVAASATGGGVEKVNMDEVFPPDDGRDLVLNNCVNCHTIVPIALARKTPDEWVSHRTQHRQRVGGLSDADADRLWGYLTRNFAPGRPIPQLPEDLLQTWTSY
jgi:mono/diheme cytochrome c family protein